MPELNEYNQYPGQGTTKGLNITGSNPSVPGATTIAGVVPIKSLKQMQEEEKRQAEIDNNTTLVQNLAAYLKQRWYYARTAKEYTHEQRMLKNVRARRGEYDPDKLSQLVSQGSSFVYMFLTSNKCRAASSWLRDVLQTSTEDKPWGIKPNPIPDLSPDILESLIRKAEQQEAQLIASGIVRTDEEVKQSLLDLKDAAYRELTEIAEKSAARMEQKMHSQMVEGGFTKAFDQFLDDLVTFPSAFLKGPIVRKKPETRWISDQKGGYSLQIQQVLRLEWERVDPFHIYPAPDASDIQDGYLIERHKLTRQDLLEMVGVEGYNDGAIRQVLEVYGKGGLRDWIYVDLTQATAEGKSTVAAGVNPSELIDALQYWGSVQGRLLRDWGLSEEEVPDPIAEYPIEAWLIGTWVIKAVVNPDPLGRRPYYKASYEEIPGVFWGNGVADLCRDTQQICNAAARSLVNNMSIASGPQVVLNISRIPDGENITQMYPWKIWQVADDPLGSNQPPMTFFQPNSQAGELMQVYETFATLADEYTGIPRYLTGGQTPGGAGRTASGLSMLMTNAGKSIKQVISNIDEHIFKPLLNRLYYYNMRYSEDNDLKGDVNIVARGAALLIEREMAMQRTNEFLGLVLNSPVVQQVVGPKGVAELVRHAAKGLDMNVDKIVPNEEQLELMQVQQQQALAAAQQAAAAQAPQSPGASPPGGTPPAVGGGAQLETGVPVTNGFVPKEGVAI